jgi:EAL domain-containing protein (putative c-di-GMP-specific phosphodiesterase class I)
LPIDFIKIDGSFINKLSSNLFNREIVIAIANVAKSIGLKTIAEFVDSNDTIDILKIIGIDYLQGYHIKIPIPISCLTCESHIDCPRFNSESYNPNIFLTCPKIKRLLKITSGDY